MPLLLALGASAIASQAVPTEAAPLPKVEAVSPANFLFAAPRARAVGDAVRIEGSVCRRANRSLISPSRVQIDHLSGTGELIETGYTYLPRLSQREDQRCGRYFAKLKTAPLPGDVVRVCLPRSHGPCAVSG